MGIAFAGKPSHGPHLRGSERRVKVDEAIWRPARGRHNIWEIIVHAAYWKYSVYRSLTGQPRGSFAIEGSNWFVRPAEKTESALRSDITLLKQYHRRLIEAVQNFDLRRLDEKKQGSKFTFRSLILGAGAHDLYHAGQVQLLKRLQQKT